MSWSRRSVRRPVATAMVFTALTVLGAFSYLRLQIDLFPELDFPSISIVTTYAGVGPEEVETLITRPIEGALARVEGIDRIESFSAEGRSRVALRFNWGMELDSAMEDVRSAMERVRDRLPEDADAPVVFRFNLTNLPVMEIAVESDLDEGRLRRFTDDVVKPYLERLSGVASVESSGARDREIRIELDAERLASLRLSARDVSLALRNETLTVPAGRVRQRSENILVRALGEFESVQQIEEALVATRDGVPIRVRDVGQVVDDFEDQTNLVRINGVAGVRASIQKSPDANTIEVCERVYEAIERFNVDYEGTAQLRVLDDNSVFIRRSIDGVQQSVILGALLALLVLVFFLQDLRATLVIGVSIPISVVGTFLLMERLGLTLNLITFGGLALGVGMLVDNAIVILENVYRKREEGASALDAAIEGSEEVGTAIVAATLTTLVVFLPVIFLGGFAAVFFRQMAMVVSSALICSLVVATTLVPVLCSLLLKSGSRTHTNPLRRALDGLDALYARSVDASLRWGAVIVVAAFAALGGAAYFAGDIGSELLPEADESEIRIIARYPAGTSIVETEAAVERIEALVREHVPETTEVLSRIGSPGFWSTSGEEFASISVNVVPVEERARSSAEIAGALQPHLSRELPGMRIFSRPGGGLWIFSFLRGGEDRLRVEIRGYDVATADALAEEIEALLATVEGVTDATASRQAGGRELRLTVDRGRAADLGISTREVAEAISTLVQGADSAMYRERGEEFRIRVRLAESTLGSMERVLSTPIALPDGGVVPLRDLVEVSEGETPQAIDRYNQERIVTIGGGIAEDTTLGEVDARVREALRSVAIPEGFSVVVAGESAEQNSAFTSLGLGIGLALALVFMVMAGQFESFVQPLIILVAVPFAGIGVVATLVLTATTLNINSLMGCVVLVGVAVNNAIVLVDYVNQMRAAGGDLRESLIETCRRRLRPILMTTATTVLALLPVAIGGGTGSENQVPLARVVVGGMTVSAVVTLFVVPVLYFGVERARERWRSRFGRRGTPGS